MPKGSQLKTRLLGVWFLCIGLGFLLLGIRVFLLDASLWQALLRWVISAGFLVLAAMYFRRGRA